MITLKEFMEVIDYRITEGDEWTWSCFGNKAYNLSTWNGDHKGYSMNIVFDTGDQTVYIVEACDYKNNRAYRLINPEHKQSYMDYADREHSEFRDQAWDNVNFVDLEADDDWIQKALAIKAGENYDTRVSIPVDFTDEELFTYMKMAHDRDITLNQLIEEALTSAINQHLKK
jgi:hypothetical protein